MTIARQLREDIDNQLLNTQTAMIWAKYATRHVSRIKEDCTHKKVKVCKEFCASS